MRHSQCPVQRVRGRLRATDSDGTIVEIGLSVNDIQTNLIKQFHLRKSVFASRAGCGGACFSWRVGKRSLVWVIMRLEWAHATVTQRPVACEDLAVTREEGNLESNGDGDNMSGATVVLRDIREPRDTRYLTATVTDKGDVVFEGQDLGDGVERVFGVREYEWIWTVRVSDVPKLTAALGGPADVLLALEAQFSGDNAAGLKSFLDAHEVPHETWSRLGD